MTIEETAQIVDFIKIQFPNYKPQANAFDVIKSWHLILNEYEFDYILIGLKKFCIENASGFPPTVGQIIECASQLAQPESMCGLEAWAVVYAAITRSNYYYLEEYEKLPALIKKAVGSSHNLKAWAEMDIATVNSVSQAQFIKAYQIEVEREREIVKMPPSMRDKYMELNPEKVLITKTEQTTSLVEDKVDMQVDEWIKKRAEMGL